MSTKKVFLLIMTSFCFLRNPFAARRDSSKSQILSVLTIGIISATFCATSTLSNAASTDSTVPTELSRPGDPTDSTVSTPPNPGDDWLLAPRSIAPNDDNSTDSETNAKTETFFPWTNVEAIGRIVQVDAIGILTEDRRTDSTRRFDRRPGGAFLLTPPVDPSVAAKFCRKIQNQRGNRDRIWLRNGDEFAGTLRSVDRRRVVFRAFDVDVSIPRGRVRAVRFADKIAPSDALDENKTNENAD